MSNLIEQGRERLSRQEEIAASCKEIFTTATDLLETNGQPVRNRLFFKHQVLRHTVNSREPEVHVDISAGADLEKANKVSVYIQGVGRLDVRKIGVEEQEEFKGKKFGEHAAYGYADDLNGSWIWHIDTVRGYLAAIKQVRSEIYPEVH